MAVSALVSVVLAMPMLISLLLAVVLVLVGFIIIILFIVIINFSVDIGRIGQAVVLVGVFVEGASDVLVFISVHWVWGVSFANIVGVANGVAHGGS